MMDYLDVKGEKRWDGGTPKGDLNRFLEKIQLNLNAQQRKAAGKTKGAILLLAVPGSGKTTVMICRLGYMIKVLNIPPKQILTMTFSRAGADDLKRRYTAVMGQLCSAEEKTPHFSTIHSFAYQVIQTYGKKSGRPVFEVIEDNTSILRRLYRQLFKTWPGDTELEEIKSALAMVKNKMLDEDEIASADLTEIDFPKMMQKYEAYKRQHKLMDYDDMLVYALGLLKREKALYAFFVHRYRYINLDEAQDTSRLQFELINLIAKHYGNLFMVGDEDQSIYGFRGACPRELLDFKKIWPKGEVLLMETNYRSSGKLVQAADDFIRINPDRYEKHMITQNASGIDAVQEFVKNRREQYRLILDCVRQEGKETAILYRNNESVIPIVDLFERNAIPYRIKEHNPVFFSHFVVRDIRNFYMLAEDPSNFELFSTMYYQLSCGISRENIQRLEKTHRKHHSVFKETAQLKGIPVWLKEKILDAEDHLKKLKKLPSNKGIELICQNLGYREYLDYRVEKGYPQEKISQKIGILRTLAERYPNKDEFWCRLADLELLLQKQKEKFHPHAVTLSTIHSSKGLEWEKVLMIDCIDGEFPSSAALKDTQEGKALMAEEVRLFYVGVTRAKQELVFINIGKKNKPSVHHPVSRFIRHYFRETKNKGDQNEKTG